MLKAPIALRKIECLLWLVPRLAINAAKPRAIIIAMNSLPRITFDPNIMGGRACLRGLRVTVGMIVGLVAAGRTTEEILAAYPYLEEEDLRQALRYAAWRSQERDLPLTSS